MWRWRAGGGLVVTWGGEEAKRGEHCGDGRGALRGGAAEEASDSITFGEGMEAMLCSRD